MVAHAELVSPEENAKEDATSTAYKRAGHYKPRSTSTADLHNQRNQNHFQLIDANRFTIDLGTLSANVQ